MKRRILTLVLSCSLIFGAVPAYAQEIKDSISAVYTYSMPFDTKLKTVDGQLYISARDAATLLGAGISWDSSTKTAVIFETDHTLVFKVGEAGYYNNSVQMYSSNKPVIIDETCYISLADCLKGAGRRYEYLSDGSINVLCPLKTYNSGMMTSDEYAQQYLNKPSTNQYYKPYVPYSTNGTYSPNANYYNKFDYDYNKYEEYANELYEKAEQAKKEAAELQQYDPAYEEAARDAYIKYKMDSLNASTYGPYAGVYEEAARQEYEAALAKLGIYN